jgi:hypothetical protein
MENIYYGKSKSKSHKVNLMDLMLTSFQENGFKPQHDSFGDESAAWIELTKKTQKPSLVTVNICFDYEERNRITEINIYENPIITIVDEEKTTVIVNI